MKKSLSAVAFVSLALSLTACNNFSGTSTTSAPAPSSPTVNQAAASPAAAVNTHAVASQVTSVAQLDQLRDESVVRLKGRVVKALHDEDYEFTDGTGTVVVEIDHELWQGRAVTANDTITIVGELDVDYRPMKHLSVDVQMIEF